MAKSKSAGVTVFITSDLRAYFPKAIYWYTGFKDGNHLELRDTCDDVIAEFTDYLGVADGKHLVR